MFDINNCTLQEACDYAVLKIVEQGGECLDELTGKCVYGDGVGKHCAVGWLLDHNNEQLMKFTGGIHDLLDEFDNIPSIFSENLSTFTELQDFHDVQLEGEREHCLECLSFDIDITAPQYRQWVEMGG